jgi:hypothetical protein
MARTKRAEAAEAIVDAFVAGTFGLWTDGRDVLKGRFQEQLKEGLGNERATGVKRILQASIEKLEKI